MNSYTFHINLYDLAFLGAIFIGLNFALLLFFTQTVNRSANRFLAIALLTIVAWMVRVLAIDLRLETYLPGWDKLPLQFLLALGPLIYFYVLKITRPKYTFTWKDLLHFAPLLLEQAALVLEVKESVASNTPTYATHAFQQLNPVLQLCIFISLISYLRACDKLIQNFYRRQLPVLMDRPLLEFRWLRRLLGATALLSLLWIFCAGVDYFGYHNQLGMQVYYTFYIFFMVIIIWTAAAAFLKPQAAVTALATTPVKPQVPVELKAKGIWLKRAMEANLYYQDPELSLSSLAEKLDLPPHELSRLINSVFNKNFNDFINEYRVRDVISKMKNQAYDSITLLGIAYESGFNSQRTFSRVFKEMTGKTPAEYKNCQKKDLPNDNLATLSRIQPIILRTGSPSIWASKKLNRNFMFKNYFKTAWRDITRNKVYSSLNICGLAIGMAVALLIGLWIIDQCSYDRFTPQYQQAYQVKYNFSNNGVVETTTDVAIPLAAALKNDVPEIACTAAAYGPAPYGNQTAILQVGEKKISPIDMTADKDFLKIIQLPLLEGNAETALNNPDDVVITESVAKVLFGSTSVIGKTILINHWHNTKVTAVLKDLPHNSTLQFGFITSFSDFTRGWASTATTNWNLNLFKIYASLKPNVTFAQVAPKIKGIVQKYAPATYRSFKQQVTMQPMQNWHLYTEYKNGIEAGGLIDYVWMFGIIGILVLLIACINFMNLSTARSAKRAKEVGIRKVIGSSTGRLIEQFLLESVLMSALAFILCLFTVYIVLPAFNTLAGTHIVIPFGNGLFWLLMLSYIIFTGLLAGSRPAFYLSGMQPVKVLKGKIATGSAASQLRRVLVVLQFTCSIALISATVVVYQQIEYARNRPRGYDPNRLVISEAGGVRYADLKHEVMETGVVSNITQCLNPVTDVYSSRDMIDNWPGKQPGEVFTPVGNGIGDTDYFKTVGIPFVAGHNFTGKPATDSNGVILNEAAVRHMRLKQPLNQIISWSFSWVPTNMRVIGVVKDVVSSAPFAQPEPAIYIFQPGWSFTVMYRLTPQVGTQAALQKLEPIFNKYRPDYPFTYHFADENYAAKFGQEQLVGKLAGIFAALAIFISCLGLFGLAAYMAEQRTKEIGIRKVLGASVPQVVMLIAKDFVVLVGISCLIASPVAFYFLQQWLNGYYYRIHIGPGVFIASAVIAITITIVTISFQAFKAALMNPVKSLRTE